MSLYPIAAITDEFSPDIEVAVRSMRQLGMKGAELRMVFGKNIIDLSDEELDRAIAIVRGAGLEIISIASPLLKCVLPDAPEVDSRYQQDIFASKHTFEDQPRRWFSIPTPPSSAPRSPRRLRASRTTSPPSASWSRPRRLCCSSIRSAAWVVSSAGRMNGKSI